mmetsp:Transcript_8618/g.8115  ORF Transcript_8618/g.8115 Transcript_8618/m.8115 type:complete len:127 (+) Transcript_8618:343-723(+)
MYHPESYSQSICSSSKMYECCGKVYSFADSVNKCPDGCEVRRHNIDEKVFTQTSHPEFSKRRDSYKSEIHRLEKIIVDSTIINFYNLRILNETIDTIKIKPILEKVYELDPIFTPEESIFLKMYQK